MEEKEIQTGVDQGKNEQTVITRTNSHIAAGEAIYQRMPGLIFGSASRRSQQTFNKNGKFIKH